MSHPSKRWKQWVRIAVFAVVAADGLLAYANWSSTDAGARAAVDHLKDLRQQHKMLGADVRRVTAIRDRLSDVERDASKFYRDEFLAAGTGYSAIIADLNQISKASALQATNVGFKEHVLEMRGVTEITVTATVDGDYVSVVRFINGLERSKNFYLLDSLTLASSTAGNIKLNLQLRTYFRS